MKKWKLERLVDGEWCFYGMYTANFIAQLAAAVEELVKSGFEVYKTIRITEVGEDG